MTTTATSPLADRAGDGDGSVSVAVQTELMMDYQMITPFADASKTLAAAALYTSQAGFFTITSSGGVALVAPDPGSDTGWAVTDLQFPYGTVTDIAAYQDWYSASVVWACTTSGVYYASSLYQWAWTPADLDQPAGSVIGGVRGTNCAYADLPSVVAVEVEQTNYPLPQSQLYCQPSGQPAYNNMITYPGAFLDWSAGPVMLPGWPVPQPGAFVCEPGNQDFGEPAGVQCITGNAEVSPLFLAGSYPVLATTLNSSGWLEAFVIDADGSNSLNYLSLAGSAFTKVPIAQTPGDNGQQVTSYPIGSVAAVTDGRGVIHVIAGTTDGTVLHIAQSQSSATGWAIAAPIAELNGPAELTACTDEDGDVHVFARADRSGQVTHLGLASQTGDWTTETISIDVPHQDYVEQIATYSATLSVFLPNGMTGCGLSFYISATEPVTVQIDGSEVDLDEEILYPGITGPDGQVVIVWPTSSLSAPTLAAWFEGMPETDRIAVDLSGPIQATIDAVQTGDELLALPTASSYKLQYSTGTVLNGVTPSEADAAATAISTVMGLTAVAAPADGRLHPSSRRHAARYIADWDGSKLGKIDRTGRPDQFFRLNFSSDRPLYEPLDAASATAARAELTGAGSWLPNVSWGDVFDAVEDVVGTVTSVVVSAVGDAIDATITMVVAGVQYVWDAVVEGVGQLLDLVQTIFASLNAAFWALVGWLGWVFNWNDILLTHQAISYFVTNGIDWTKYALNSVQGKLDNAIAGIQADLASAVADYLATQVQSGSTLGSLYQSQPAPPPGADGSGDPRNVFGRALRVNGNSATITAGTCQVPAPVATAAEGLLSQVEQYGTAAQSAPQMQALATMSQPTVSDTAGIFDQPLAEVVQAMADGAAFGLGLVQTGADAMFGLASESVDGINNLLTQTWDIPLLTDLYQWVTNGSSLTALDVICLLLAVPATISYKAIFGETPIPDQATLQAVEAAYPAPPAAGGQTAALPAPEGASSDGAGDTPTPLEIGMRLGSILTGLSYMSYGFLEARVDLYVALWTALDGTSTDVPRCPDSWQGEWWVLKPVAIWQPLLILNEFLTAMFSGMVTVAPNAGNWDCSEAAGMANWLWAVGNLPWIADFAANLRTGKLVRGLWSGGGPFLISVWGVIQIILDIVVWSRQGRKGWLGSVAALLTDVPQACKYLMSPQATWASDDIPVAPLIEAAIDVDGNLFGGIFWVLAGAIVT
ncbi:MAG TPA: hypothetical protein VN840_19595 [Streptosporangiaceae bacterium]|nr:hypothetical protein [Streptosporangiaceae bacterium]